MATVLSSVMVLALGVGLLPASASAAQASAPTLQNAAPSVTRLLGFDSNRAFVRVGGQLTDTVTVTPRAARTVYVQSRRAGTTRFTTAYKAKASAQGSFTAFLMPRSAGTWQFRLVVVATTRAKNVVSPLRTVKASGRAVPTKIVGFSTARSTVTVGATIRDLVRVSPRASRLIEVQARRAGTRTWMKTSMSGKSTRAGNFLAVYRPTAGVWQYRLVVKASPTARTGVTATRTITAKRVVVTPRDTTAPGMVTGVTSTVALNSITLAWTNPTAADFSGVTIVRKVGIIAPVSISDGIVVAKTLKAVTSFTNTGLTTGTKYAYALFAHDSAGNHAAAVKVLRETTGTGPVTGLLADPDSSTLSSIMLRWVHPTDPDFTGVVIRRAVGATAPATVTEGTLAWARADDEVPYVVDTGLTAGTQYSYSVFAHDSANNYAAAAKVTFTTEKGGPGTARLSISRNGGVATTNLTAGVPFDFDAGSSSAITGKNLSSATINYGDGSVVQPFSATADPSFWSLNHTYAAPGTYQVTLTVIDSAGVPATVVVPVTVAGALTSAITIAGSPAPVQVTPGASVLFDLASSAGATSYSLIVSGDVNGVPTVIDHANAGAAPESSQAITFDTVGTYLVLFSVSNAAGQSSVVDQMEVTVRSGVTAAVLSISDSSSNETTTSLVGDELFFYAGDSIVGMDAVSVVLDYGDGTTPREFDVADADRTNWSDFHTYDAEGTYQVTMTVTPATGPAVVTTVPFTVSPVVP